MAAFLEAVVGPARMSPVAYITSLGSREIEDFIEPQMNKGNTKYMHRSGRDRMDAKQREEYETLQHMRRAGLKLTSASETWVGKCGMHWPEYFFGKREDIGNKELEYGKGPKFDTSWADYWKWMASNNSQT